MTHKTLHGLIGLGTLGAMIFAGSATALASNETQTPASQISAASVAAPSGQAMPVGDLPGWRQIFADDLTTAVPLGSFPAAVSSQWGAYPSPWKDTTGNGTYSPKKTVSVADGVLTADIHSEGGTALIAALQPKIPAGTTYGRYAVRYRFDSLAGYKMAWMLWPDSNNNKRDGEIDFPEMNLDGPKAWGFVHRTDNTGPDDQAWFNVAAGAGPWHTAVIEWTPNLVLFTSDGVEVGRTSVRVPSTPMHWVLQTETALTTGTAPAASVRGNVQIDWAAAWAYEPATTHSAQGSVDYVPVVPARLLDSRPGETTIDGLAAGIGVREAGSVTELQVGGRGGVPANATAAVLNVSVTDTSAPGFITVWPCGSPQPLTSNLNYTAGQTIPNLVIAKLGTDGKVCIATHAATPVIADVNGYFPIGADYTALVPARLLDSRPGEATIDGISAGRGLRTAGMVTELQVGGRGGVPANAAAAVINVSVTDTATAGFITVWPCGSPQPLTSNLNFAAGQTIANLVVAKLGTGGRVCIVNNGATHLLADVNGYFPDGARYTALNPARVLDSRPGETTIDGLAAGIGVRPAGSVTELQIGGRGNVPANASAVVLNVSVTDTTAPGFITVWPCGTPQPLASNLNYTAGQTIPNLVIAKLGTDGKVCIATYAGTDLLADINGYFPASS